MPRTPAIPLVILLALSAATAVAQRAAAPKVTVFERGRVFIGDGSPWIEDAALVVEGTRILQLGRRAEIKVPRGAARVNLSGKTVTPMIIDTQTRLPGSREALEEQLQRRAYYGAVAVTGLAFGAADPLFQLRDGTFPMAARLFTAGTLASGKSDRPEIPNTISSEADARRAVQDLAAKRPDLITVKVDGGEGEPKLTPEVYRAVVDEAHKRGLRVMGQAQTLADVKDLLRAGVDALNGVMHDKSFDRELLLLFREHRNVIVVPRMGDPDTARDVAWLRDSLRPDEFARLSAAEHNRPEAQAAFLLQRQIIGRLNIDKVRFALGSDSDTPWGHLLGMEDVTGPLLPFEVINAASSGSAALLGLKDYGALVPGKFANFMVFDGNPAMDIKELRNVRSIYLDGALVDRAAIRARWLGAPSR